jgi:hypothetical protein
MVHLLIALQDSSPESSNANGHPKFLRDNPQIEYLKTSHPSLQNQPLRIETGQYKKEPR